MIPREAWFYWDQGEAAMPTLRRAAVETFKIHNPGWKVNVLDRSVVPEIEGDTDRARILRSDLARYVILAKHGGFYFDTDIIFVDAVPDQWMEADFCMSTDDDGMTNSVATIGASPSNLLLARVLERAMARLADTQTIMSYQSLGVKLWWALGPPAPAAAALNMRWRRIPTQTFLPIAWPFVEVLWSPRHITLPNDIVGLHWYGGDALSREYEAAIETGGLDVVDCPVTRLVKGGVSVRVA